MTSRAYLCCIQQIGVITNEQPLSGQKVAFSLQQHDFHNEKCKEWEEDYTLLQTPLSQWLSHSFWSWSSSETHVFFFKECPRNLIKREDDIIRAHISVMICVFQLFVFSLLGLFYIRTSFAQNWSWSGVSKITAVTPWYWIGRVRAYRQCFMVQLLSCILFFFSNPPLQLIEFPRRRQ